MHTRDVCTWFHSHFKEIRQFMPASFLFSLTRKTCPATGPLQYPGNLQIPEIHTDR